MGMDVVIALMLHGCPSQVGVDSLVVAVLVYPTSGLRVQSSDYLDNDSNARV